MQAEYSEGVGPIEDFFPEELVKRLEEGAEKVSVFEKGSKAHEEAKKKRAAMTPNQKRRLREKLKKMKQPGDSSV